MRAVHVRAVCSRAKADWCQGASAKDFTAKTGLAAVCAPLKWCWIPL